MFCFSGSFKNNVTVLLAGWLLAACSSRSSPLSPSQKRFSGIESLSSNGDGTYSLKWPRTTASGVVFSVYSRVHGREFDFRNPESRTTFFSYRTKDLRTQTIPTCYLVRAAIEGQEEDTNSHELCTDGNALGDFRGVKALTKNDDGTYLLSWDGLNFPDVQYAVYINSDSGVSSFDFSTPPHAIVSGSLFKSALFSLGERHCFVVRYIGSGLPPDSNANSLCTAETPSADFRGISNVQTVGPGLVRALWAKTTHPDVVGYHIYKSNSFSPTDIVATVDADQGSAYVDGLIPEQKYFFAVRSFDRYGSEDTNTTLWGPYSYASPVAPRFEGVASTTLTGTSVKLSWKPASGSPAGYRVYLGIGPHGTTPSVNYDSVVEEIKAPASTLTRSCFEKIQKKAPPESGNETVKTCLGDKMAYTFAVRAFAGGLEEFNTKTLTVNIPDGGAPQFQGVAATNIENGAMRLSWDKAVGQTSRFEVRLWPQAGSEPIGDCHTVAHNAASAVSGSLCVFSGECTSAYVVKNEDFNEYLERLDIKSAEATLCKNGKPALLKTALTSNSNLKVAVTAIDGECLDSNNALVEGKICNRDSNSNSVSLNTGVLSRPTVAYLGTADSPVEINPNQMNINFFESGVPTNSLTLPGDVLKYKLDAKECYALNESHTCIQWGPWSSVGEFAIGTLTAPLKFPPDVGESAAFKSKIATQYCVSLRFVNNDDNDSHGVGPQGAAVPGCPFVLGSTRIPAYPEFYGVKIAHVDPAYPQRIYVGWDKLAGSDTLSHFRIYYGQNYDEITQFLRTCNRQEATPNCTLPPSVYEAPGSGQSFTLAAAGCAAAEQKSCEGFIDFPPATNLAEQKFYFAVRGFTSAPDASNDTEDINTTKLSFTVPNTLPPTFAGIEAASPVPNVIDPTHKSDVEVKWTPVPVQASYPEPPPNVTPTPNPPNAHSYLIYATALGRRGNDTIYKCADGDRPTPAAAGGDLRLVEPAAEEEIEGQKVRVSDLPDYQAYLFRVFARSVYGYPDSNSQVVCVDLPDLTPPEQTGSIATTFTMGSPRTLKISWTAATDLNGSGVTKYRIFWRTAGSGNSFTTIKREIPVGDPSLSCAATCEYTLADSSLDTDGKNFADDGLADNSGYEFLVKALDGAGNVSENSTPSEITTIIPFEMPPLFLGITSATLNVIPGAGSATFSVTIGWNPVANATGYRVFSGACDSGTLLGSTPAGIAQFIATDISGTPFSDEGNHSFCVRAFRTVNSVNYYDTNSASSSLTIGDYTSPTVSSTATLGINDATRQLTVNWSAVIDTSAIQQYHVYLKPQGGAYSFDFTNPTATVTAPTTSASLGPTGLQQGQTYEVLVRAVDNSPQHNVSINTATSNKLYRTRNAPTFTTAPTLTPATPKTGDTITCTVAFSDLDGDAITPTFVFNNVSQAGAVRQTTIATAGATTATYVLKSYAAAAGVRANADVQSDQMSCTVNLNDEQGDTASSTSTARTIANSAPAVSLADNATQVSLTGASLAGIHAYLSDPDGDTMTLEKASDDCALFPASYTVPATAGETSGTISGTTPALWSWEAAPTLLHSCAATFRAKDSVLLTSSTVTATVVVQNRPPGVFASLIAPASPNTDQALLCSNSASVDPDGDTPTFSFEWRKGAVLASATAFAPAEVTATLPASKTLVDETYWCAVTATDSRGAGASQNKTQDSKWVTIVNRNPNVPATPSMVISPDTNTNGVLDIGEVARCTPGGATSDADGSDEGGLTSTYEFLLETAPGSASFVILQSGASQDFTALAAHARRNLKCKVRVSDTHAGSSVSLESTTLLIGNSPPILSNLGPLSLAPGAALATPMGRLSATDADGDSLTYLKTYDSCSAFSIEVDGSGYSEIQGTAPAAAVVQATPYNSVCSVKVKAWDGANTSNEITVVINITNAAPGLTCPGTTRNEGLTIAGDLCTATDTDPGTLLAFAFTSDGCNLASATSFNGSKLSFSGAYAMPSATCTSVAKVTDNAGAASSLINIVFSIPTTRSVTPAWGATPTLDNECNLTIPVTSAFSGVTYTSSQGYLTPNTTAVGGCRSADYPPSTAYTLALSGPGATLQAQCLSASGCYVPTFSDTANGFNSCVRVTGNDGSTTMVARVLKPAFTPAQTLRQRSVNSTYLRDTMTGRQQPFQGCLGSTLGFDDESVSRPCGGLKGQVVAGYSSTCSLVTKGATPQIGRLSCWGDNTSTILGRAVASPATSGGEANLEVGFTDGDYSIVAIALGEHHSCMIRTLNPAPTTEGQVRCWGANERGQSGDGIAGQWLDSGASAADNTRPLSNAPFATDAFLASGISALAAGANHTCALSVSGEVRCWGDNTKGQLGNGQHDTNTGDSLHVGSAIPLTSLASGVVAITAGKEHSCALLSSGSIKCWGDNALGQLGDGTTNNADSPISVNGISNAVAITAGATHTCALRDTGNVSCWGKGTEGQLGNNVSSDSDSAVAVKIDGVTTLANAVAIAAGGETSCALINDGTLRCWGANAKGQVGDRSTANKNVATTVLGAPSTPLTGANAVSVGSDHACAILNSGLVKCWGGNGQGQLGLGTTNAIENPINNQANLGAGLTLAQRTCNVYTVGP